RDILQDHRLTGPWRCDDESTLPLAQGRGQIDHAARQILDGGIFDFEMQPFFWIERRQVVEVDSLARCFRRIEIDGVDLEERKVAFAILRRPDLTFDRVAGAQIETAYLAG